MVRKNMYKVKIIVEYEVMVNTEDGAQAEYEAWSLIEEEIRSSEHIAAITFARVLE